MRSLLVVLVITAVMQGQESKDAIGEVPDGLTDDSLEVVMGNRVDALEDKVNALQRRYEQGLDSIEFLLAAQADLSIATLDMAKSKAQRLEAIEQAYDLSLSTWRRTKALQRAGARGGDSASEASARAALFRYRIMWLKENAREHSN